VPFISDFDELWIRIKLSLVQVNNIDLTLIKTVFTWKKLACNFRNLEGGKFRW
jgi:hypothetical protein